MRSSIFVYICGDDTYIIILYCDVAFTYRHVCMLGYSYILYISCINWVYAMLIQFHYIHISYNIVEFSIMMTIYRRNRHDYNYHNKYNHHHNHHFNHNFIIMSHLFIILIEWIDCSPLGQWEWWTGDCTYSSGTWSREGS